MTANYFQNPAATFVPAPLYQPNIAGMEQALAIRQAKYDEGKSKLQGIYGSIFNQDMGNTILNQQKNQFLDNVDKKLSNLASVDLSKSENVRKAADVFGDFYKNPQFINAIDVTNFNKKQLQSGLALKNSTDPKLRDQYWDASVQDILNTMERFKNGDPNDKSIYKKASYVPFRDMNEDIQKAVKEYGYEFQYVDGANGPQLRITKGGKQAFNSAKAFVQSVIGTKYDDMFGVLGRNEYYYRYNQVKSENPYSSENEIKNKIADDFINEYSSQFKENIKDLNKQLSSNTTAMKALFDEKGNALSPEAAQLYLQYKQHNQLIEDDIKSNEDSLNRLKIGAEDRINFTNSIMNYPDSFFGNRFKNSEINNKAVGLTSKFSQEIKENTAYTKQKELEFNMQKQSNQLKQWAEENRLKELEIMNKANSNGGSSRRNTGRVDKDGNPIYETVNGLPYHITGLSETNPVREQTTYESYQQDLKREYNDIRTDQIDAVSAFIPHLIKSSFTQDKAAVIEWSSKFKKSLDGDEESKKALQSDPIQIRIRKLLDDKGIKVDKDNPESVLSSLSQVFQSDIKNLANSNNPLDESTMEAVQYNLSDIEKKLNAFNEKSKRFDEKSSEYIKEKLSKDGNFRNFIDRDKNGKLSFISSDKIIDNLRDYISSTYGIETNSPAMQGIISDIQNGINKSNVNVSKIIWNNYYKKGYIPTRFKSADAAMVDKDFNPSYGDNNISQFGKVLSSYKTEKENIDNKTASNFIDNSNNTHIGYNLELPILKPTERNPEGSEGYRVIPEILNPGSFNIPKNESSEDFKGKIQKIRENRDMVTGITYSTGGMFTLTLDKDKSEKLGLPQTVEITLTPQATGDVLKILPPIQKINAFGSILKGETWRSNDLQKNLGFRALIIPDMQGGDLAKFVVIQRWTRAWNPTKTQDENGNYIGGWEDEVKMEDQRVPVSGDNAWDIDDLWNSVNKTWEIHIARVNNVKKTFLEQSKQKNMNVWVGPTKEELDKQ